MEEKLLNEIAQQLSNGVPEQKIHNDLQQETENRKKLDKPNNDSLIKNVNNKVLIDILSPEITKNEATKRNHKKYLIILLTFFLIIQFVSVSFICSKVLNYCTTATANIDIVNSLLTFVSAYITSIIVELIAILNYIVKNVFDTSLSELVKIFKETDQTNKDTSDKE